LEFFWRQKHPVGWDERRPTISDGGSVWRGSGIYHAERLMLTKAQVVAGPERRRGAPEPSRLGRRHPSRLVLV